MKILLACEDRLLAHAISQILIQLKFDLKICNDGNRAIELLEAETFDMLISEILLPFYSGIEIIQKFMETSTLDKVLILASFNNYHFLHNSLGSEDYYSLTRPYDLRHIYDFATKKRHEST